MSEGLFVDGTQSFNRRISVRGRLKIRYEMVAVVSAAQLADSFVNLLGNRLPRQSAAWAKAAVVAKIAAAVRNRAVYVWARKTSVYADFLDTMTENAPKMKVVTIITQSSGSPVETLLKASANGFG